MGYYTGKVTKRAVADHLRKAAAIIDKYGWVQGRSGSEEEGFCATGSLWHQYSILKKNKQAALPSAGAAANAAEVVVGECCLPGWNDRQGRTKEEVTSLFRRTARALEHGMELP